jgi:hypothetical protein
LDAREVPRVMKAGGVTSRLLPLLTMPERMA